MKNVQRHWTCLDIGNVQAEPRAVSCSQKCPHRLQGWHLCKDHSPWHPSRRWGHHHQKGMVLIFCSQNMDMQMRSLPHSSLCKPLISWTYEETWCTWPRLRCLQAHRENKSPRSVCQISLEHRSPNLRLYPCTLTRFIQTLQNSHQESRVMLCVLFPPFPWGRNR